MTIDRWRRIESLCHAAFLETPIDAASRPSFVGRQLGAYRIEVAIGAGGMGEVYRVCGLRRFQLVPGM